MEDCQKYITLQEATKYCKYSQEYLSLRARQGKLKAKKMGRNWSTTKEWLHDYLVAVEEYTNGSISKLNSDIKSGYVNDKVLIVGRALTGSDTVEIGSVRADNTVSKRSSVLPPDNLPVGEFEIIKPVSWIRKVYIILDNFLQDFSAECSFIFKNAIYFNDNFRFKIVCFFVLFFSVVGIFQTKELFAQIFSTGYFYTRLAENSAGSIFSKSFSSVSNNIHSAGYGLGLAVCSDDFYCDIFNDSLDVFGDYGSWLKGNIDMAFSLFPKEKISSAFAIAQEKYFSVDDSLSKNISNFSDKYSHAYYSSIRFSSKIANSVDAKSKSFSRLAIENTGIASSSVKSVFSNATNSINSFTNKLFVFLFRYLGFGNYPTNGARREDTGTTNTQSKNENGIVVVPSTNKDEELKSQIKNSFSDEVSVDIKDESSGIIKPVFKNKKETNYLYILVPTPAPD